MTATAIWSTPPAAVQPMMMEAMRQTAALGANASRSSAITESSGYTTSRRQGLMNFFIAMEVTTTPMMEVVLYMLMQ